MNINTKLQKLSQQIFLKKADVEKEHLQYLTSLGIENTHPLILKALSNYAKLLVDGINRLEWDLDTNGNLKTIKGFYETSKFEYGSHPEDTPLISEIEFKITYPIWIQVTTEVVIDYKAALKPLYRESNKIFQILSNKATRMFLRKTLLDKLQTELRNFPFPEVEWENLKDIIEAEEVFIDIDENLSINAIKDSWDLTIKPDVIKPNIQEHSNELLLTLSSIIHLEITT